MEEVSQVRGWLRANFLVQVSAGMQTDAEAIGDSPRRKT
jgi:hypothetical protein